MDNDYSYITFRIYFYLFVAYFKGYVEVKDTYKNFDLLLKSKLMKHESIGRDVVTKSSSRLFLIGTQRKYQEKTIFYITTEGKKQFIKTNWKLAGILFGFIGFIFAIVELVLPFFI